MEAQPVADEAMTVETAQAYQALCAFCSWALLADVGEEDVARLAGDRSLFLEPPFSQVAPRAAEELAGWLAQADGEGGVSSLAREAHLDRSYLFYMVGQSRTSPYESVYRTDDATLYGPTTFQVREAYAAHGLAFGRSANEPDDHLGLELSFLAFLLGLAAEGEGGPAAGAGASAGDPACPAAPGDPAASCGLAPDPACDPAALADAAAFLSNHVLVFSGIYLKNLRTRARTPFYRAVAGVAQATLGALSAALGARAAETLDESRFALPS